MKLERALAEAGSLSLLKIRLTFTLVIRLLDEAEMPFKFYCKGTVLLFMPQEKIGRFCGTVVHISWIFAWMYLREHNSYFSYDTFMLLFLWSISIEFAMLNLTAFTCFALTQIVQKLWASFWINRKFVNKIDNFLLL